MENSLLRPVDRTTEPTEPQGPPDETGIFSKPNNYKKVSKSKISLGSIAVPIDILELIYKLKNTGETNGDIVKRVILDWLNIKEDKKNLEHILRWKDKNYLVEKITRKRLIQP